MKLKAIAVIIILTGMIFLNGSDEWYKTGELKGYPTEFYLIGLGMGANQDEALSAASLEIASQLRTSIKGEVNKFTESLESNGNVSYTDYFSKSTSMVVDESVAGIQIIKQEKIKGKYYLLAVLDKGKYSSALRVELDSMSDIVSGLFAKGSSLLEEGNISLAIESYFEAQEYLPEFYAKAAFYNAIAFSSFPMPQKLNINEQFVEIKGILSGIKIDIAAGNRQKAPVGTMLPQPVVAEVTYKHKPISNFPLIVRNAEDKKMDAGMTNEAGQYEIWLQVEGSDKEKNNITVTPNKSFLPSTLRKYVFAEERAVYEISDSTPLEFTISVKDESGNTVDKLIKKVERDITKMGYHTAEKAILGLEGIVEVSDTQEVDGYKGTQYLTEAEMQLFLMINKENKKVGSLVATGKGLSPKSEKQSIEAAYKKLKIKKKDLSELLAEAQEELQVIFEKESAKFLQEGRMLYDQGKFNKAIRSLAHVTHGDDQVTSARSLIKTIQQQQREIEEARLARIKEEKEKDRQLELEKIRLEAEKELKLEKARLDAETEQQKIQAETERQRIEAEKEQKEAEPTEEVEEDNNQ